MKTILNKEIIIKNFPDLEKNEKNKWFEIITGVANNLKPNLKFIVQSKDQKNFEMFCKSSDTTIKLNASSKVLDSIQIGQIWNVSETELRLDNYLGFKAVKITTFTLIETKKVEEKAKPMTLDLAYYTKNNKVVFMAKNGMDYELEEARHIFVAGQVLTVKSIYVCGWNSKVELKEFPDKTFNTVMFCNI